jgi:hypothetical protein
MVKGVALGLVLVQEETSLSMENLFCITSQHWSCYMKLIIWSIRVKRKKLLVEMHLIVNHLRQLCMKLRWQPFLNVKLQGEGASIERNRWMNHRWNVRSG